MLHLQVQKIVVYQGVLTKCIQSNISCINGDSQFLFFFYRHKGLVMYILHQFSKYKHLFKKLIFLYEVVHL